MTSRDALRQLVQDAPEGALLSVPRSWLATLLADGPPQYVTASHSPADQGTWREKLWTVPVETRLGVAEVAEAIGRPKSFVYRHTSEKAGGSSRLPHRKLDGELTFVAGEIRVWLKDQEEIITPSRGVERVLTLEGKEQRVS